jgi:hypothetical protein
MRRRDFMKAAAGGAVAIAGRSPIASSAESSKSETRRFAPRFGDRRDWWFSKRFDHLPDQNVSGNSPEHEDPLRR